MNEIIPHAFPKTGAKRSSTIPKSPSREGEAVAIPAVYRPDYSTVPVYYQRQLPTCGANAGTFLSNVLNNRVGCPESLWIPMREIDGLPPTDGSTFATIGQASQNDGVVDLSLLIDNTELTPQEYANPSLLTPPMKTNAITAGLDSLTTQNGPFTMDELRQLIYTDQVVIALVECGDGWWTKNGVITWQASDLFPVRLGNFTDDHYIVLVGYDENYIYFRNSWSEQWGISGDGYFDQTYLSSVIEVGTGTAKTIPSVSALQRLINWFGGWVNRKLGIDK